jgi:hypothetical protein
MARGKGKSRTVLESELKSDMSQKWIYNSTKRTHSDQFGFVIHVGNEYRLCYKGESICSLHSMPAARMISTIILNDIIMHKKIE